MTPLTFVVPSALVTVFGIVTNLLSLSYYVTRRNSNDRVNTTETLNKRLFIFLNSFDILVCISLMGWLLLDNLGEEKKVIMSVFMFMVGCTGFITCLLSMIRSISVIWPHYQLNNNLIIVASVCFCSGEVILQTLVCFGTMTDITKTANFIILIVMFVVVIFSNGLCIAKLASSQMVSWKRDATITMGILSMLFCFFNVGFLAMLGIRVFKCGDNIQNSVKCLPGALGNTCLYILLPLNSACNPIVYFIRNAEMRRYLIQIYRRILGSCRNMEDRQEQNVTISDVTRPQGQEQ